MKKKVLFFVFTFFNLVLFSQVNYFITKNKNIIDGSFLREDFHINEYWLTFFLLLIEKEELEEDIYRDLVEEPDETFILREMSFVNSDEEF